MCVLGPPHHNSWAFPYGSVLHTRSALFTRKQIKWLNDQSNSQHFWCKITKLKTKHKRQDQELGQLSFSRSILESRASFSKINLFLLLLLFCWFINLFVKCFDKRIKVKLLWPKPGKTQDKVGGHDSQTWRKKWCHVRAETNLEYTAHLLEAAAAAAVPLFFYAAPPPPGSHTASSCLYGCDRHTGSGNGMIQVTLG